MKNNFGIYVHIPFCLSKCDYCSFVSKNASQKDILNYINFLCTEISISSNLYYKKEVSSIYFGGGTPSFIDEKYIKQILNTIYNNYNVSKNAEISIECNPCSTTKQKLKEYKKIGINRLSFGVQSLNDCLLKTLGRRHTSNQAINVINLAKDVGFNNISCDLMIGIPNQTKQDLLSSINTLCNLGINHISAYMLMLERGTPIYKKVKNKELFVVNDDECINLYENALNLLNKFGFNRYEISNFAKVGYECKHNQNYWSMGEYVGFGISAHSYANGVRFNNASTFNSYYKRVQSLKNNEAFIKNSKDKGFLKMLKIIDNTSYEVLTARQNIEECIMLSLRTSKGINIQDLNDLNYDILNEKKDILKKLQQHNIITIQNNHIALTPQNYGICSAVVLELI